MQETPKVPHILFASDFSRASETAFAQVLALARPLHARVTLLHVYQVRGPGLDQVYKLIDPAFFEKIENELLKNSAQALEVLKERLEAEQVEADIVYGRGHPGEQIVAQAQNLHCSLIVLGSRGLGAADAYLLGSTSRYVLHHSPIPVLIVPGSAERLQILF